MQTFLTQAHFFRSLHLQLTYQQLKNKIINNLFEKTVQIYKNVANSFVYSLDPFSSCLLP